MTALSQTLDACSREPIHIPGSIQPHGALLAIEPGGRTVAAASRNASAMLGHGGASLQGRNLSDLAGVGVAIEGLLGDWRDASSSNLQARVAVDERPFDAVVHESDGLLIVELEPVDREEMRSLERIYSEVGGLVEQMQRLSEPADLCRLAAEKIREMSGFDRVLAYRFDHDLHGTVIAEEGNGVLPAYLGRRFPASDIPAQARELYRRNRLRIIPDAYYEPDPIEPDRNPLTGAAIDLSQSTLRSVSPVHVEYMRNMGTGASMSASILVGSELWGLVSCHNLGPKKVPLQIRNAIGFIAQILSIQIAMNERGREAAERVEQQAILSRLLAQMTASTDFAEALAAQPVDLLAQTDADGAAIATDDRIIRVGRAPEEADVARLVEWLEAQDRREVFETEHMARHMEGAERFADRGSGVLAVSISSLHPSYLVWFRSEKVRTVEWSGEPTKVAADDTGRLHPRHSFEAWKEEVRHTSSPWLRSQVAAAGELRNAIIGIVLRQAEERARLTGQLEASNRELESFSYSISHDLRAPFRHIVGYAELLRAQVPDLDDQASRYLDTITSSAAAAGRLVDDLLRFSQLGRTSLRRQTVDLQKLVDETMRSLETDVAGRDIDWHVATLPQAVGDAGLLRQVLYNLVSNAIKYSRQSTSPRIEITGWRNQGATMLRVADNGVGFDMAYVHKLFGVFQRLHHVEDFEGTGIGLAIARRIVERHGGTIQAEGKVGSGARFTVALPDKLEDEDDE